MKAFVIGLLAALVLLPVAPAHAAERVSCEAMLILANNDGAPLDRRLDQFGNTLRRLFKFEYFKRIGGGQATVNLPSEFTIDLGEGHSLKVKATGKGDRIHAEVNWVGDGKSLLRTTVSVKRGAPAILGGVPDKARKGTLIVTLTLR